MPSQTTMTNPPSASRRKALGVDQARDIISPPLLNIMGLKLRQLHLCNDARAIQMEESST